MSSSSGDTIGFLGSLQDYADAVQSGNAALKSSVWQMTKLRRKQMRGLLTLEDTFSNGEFREELWATTRLLLNGEADQGSESDSPGVTEWQVKNFVDSDKGNKENELEHKSESTSDGNEGLRQRKKEGNKTASKSSSSEKEAKSMIEVDERDSIKKRDPVDLLPGVRPSDLKHAQKLAMESLKAYVLAANQAAILLRHMEQIQK